MLCDIAYLRQPFAIVFLVLARRLLALVQRTSRNYGFILGLLCQDWSHSAPMLVGSDKTYLNAL